MDHTLTQKQREAVEALEGAQRAGVPLSDYAKGNGLELRPVYDAIATLRRRGVLPSSDRPRKRKSRFVAVRVTSSPAPVTEIERASRSGLVRRLVHSVAECNAAAPVVRPLALPGRRLKAYTAGAQEASWCSTLVVR
jgi:hypothetical protein